jgi:hypothetical protein
MSSHLFSRRTSITIPRPTDHPAEMCIHEEDKSQTGPFVSQPCFNERHSLKSLTMRAYRYIGYRTLHILLVTSFFRSPRYDSLVLVGRHTTPVNRDSTNLLTCFASLSLCISSSTFFLLPELLRNLIVPLEKSLLSGLVHLLAEEPYAVH